MQDLNSLLVTTLIQRIQRRKTNNASAASALAELYDLIGGQVYSLAAFILGEGADAQQVTRDVFLQVWKQTHLYEHDAKLLLCQLLTQTKHAAIGCWRTTGAVQSEAINMLEPAAHQHAAWPQDPLWRSLCLCMTELNQTQRNMLTLSYYYGFTQQEIATKLSVSCDLVTLEMKRIMDTLCNNWFKNLLEYPSGLAQLDEMRNPSYA